MTEEYKSFIANNIESVRTSISRLSHGNATLLAATKTVPAEVINYTAKEHGITCIGENKAQELIEKYPYLDTSLLHIHFIGHLQSNKVKQIVDKVEMIHSLDSLTLAKEIGKRSLAIGKTMPVLAEINIACEPDKGGVLPQNAEEFIRQAAEVEGIRISGLMTMAPAGSTHDEYIKYFGQVRDMFRCFSGLSIPGVYMETLSMGMSDSYPEALGCGANLIRVGSAIFGKRTGTVKTADASPENGGN